jgi:hypothetical protein
MLTKGDEYPVHQTPEPIAFAGTDRNFYDRYFFNGYHSDGSDFFALAFGVYPQLNVADAHFSCVRGDVQHCIHGSRILDMERMDLSVGPIRIEIIEPLQQLRLIIDNHEGISAELVFTGRAFPIEEPRFTRRNGSRMFMDYTRMTQNGRWQGWIEVDGQRTAMDGAVGTRDRSWGIRPIGANDPQPNLPIVAPQFYWLWSPVNFADSSLFFHVNADAEGAIWNSRAVLCDDNAPQGSAFETAECQMQIDLKPGWRHAVSATLEIGGRRPATATFTPISLFMMRGIGYTNPEWQHGGYKGALVIEREDIDLNSIAAAQPDHLHVQAISRVEMEQDGRRKSGVGILEQLIIGRYSPLGLESLFGD